MFRRLPDDPRGTVTIELDGETLTARAGDTVAAAMLAAGIGHTRTTPVGGAARLPYCMMGVCFDCLMEIDGVPNRQACLVRVRDGMTVRRQQGARDVLAGESVE
jgi:predicted molibdopterin-dependent oxidoreductase YjgC